ncbi:branched-chain-amino-acid transaminase [Bacillus thuringiensis]
MKPDYMWFNGKVVPWKDASVHIWSEVVIRGASVFEGIRAYWNEETETYNILGLDEHIKRLFQSAKLLKFPEHMSESEIKNAIYELLYKLDYREHTLIRPTLYIAEGRYGYKAEDTKVGDYIVAFPVPHPDKMFEGIKCCVSTWRRANELDLSPRIKAGASYSAFRLPRIEAMEQGKDDVILLNNRDTVAEASGATIFIIKDGKVHTPSVASSILESITRKKLMEMFEREFNMEVIEREVLRTELYTADEVFICGTLCEIQPVIEIDNYVVGNGEIGYITNKLIRRFLDITDKGINVPDNWLSEVPKI